MIINSVCGVINAVRIILLDAENILYDASLVVYINGTSIPPIMIMNRIYENQNLFYIIPLIQKIITVRKNNIVRMVRGCFVCVNISIVVILADINSLMSGGFF
jgi:hypothetical protein